MSKSIRLLRRLDKLSFFGLISMEMAVIFYFFVLKNRYFYDYLNDFFVENDYFLNGAHLYDPGK